MGLAREYSQHADADVIVVLDAMGVIYQPGADVDDLLVPFVRERGCTQPQDEIVSLYDEASRGLLTTRELWSSLGVSGDSAMLDSQLVARYTITDGLYDFLHWCQGAGIPVACISNDISAWAAMRAHRFGLSDTIVSWTISGDVGHRKPSEAIYDAFLAAAPSAATCLFIDDNIENVTAAASRGMHSLLFRLNSDSPPTGIPSVSSFSSLAALIAEERKTG